VTLKLRREWQSRVQDASLTTRIGEMSVQWQKRARHNPRSKPHQLELFAPPIVRGTTPVPDWQTLPAATRRALTTLLARLILDHRDGDGRADEKEVRRDD